MRILVVEDNLRLADTLADALRAENYMIDIANDGLQRYEDAASGIYDILILDLMLPKMNGYEVLEYAKSLEIPVIFLTAMGETAQRVRGLRMGAEDYICKPFEITELLARVETVLRRYKKTDARMYLLDIVIDTESRMVFQNGKQVELTLKEYELLLLFVRNKNRALYRETIYENVWGGEYSGTGRTVDLHVQRLKKKLGLEEHITAIYKVGYRLVV